VAGCCEHGNEILGSIKCGVFLDKLSDYKLLKEDSVELVIKKSLVHATDM
jgi:hypothetical protein